MVLSINQRKERGVENGHRIPCVVTHRGGENQPMEGGRSLLTRRYEESNIFEI